MAKGEAARIASIAEAEAAQTEMTGKADASKVRYLGEAEASRIRNVGESEAYSQKAVGEGNADAYKAQVDAMGEDNIARLKIIEAIAEGKIKVVPDILVSSCGTNGNLSDILTLFLTQKVVEDTKKVKELKTP
jgi:uncharacterized membrane protein YqiK